MRGDELLRDLQAKKEPRACCGNIETSGIRGADFLLNETGRGGEKHIGSRRCHDDEIDLFP